MSSIQGYGQLMSGEYFYDQIEYYQKQYIVDLREQYPELSNKFTDDNEFMRQPELENAVVDLPLTPVWMGKIAQNLNIDNKLIVLEDFEKASAGYTPTSDLKNNPTAMAKSAYEVIDGKIAIPETGSEDERRVGLEILFTTDKGWSSLYATADKETRKIMDEINNEAIIDVFKEMERNATLRKNGKEQKVGGLLYTVMNHVENRGASVATTSEEKSITKIKAPQPFRHGHGILFNTSIDEEGNYYALNSQSIVEDMSLYNAIYTTRMTDLARSRLGLEYEAKFVKGDANKEMLADHQKSVMCLVPKFAPEDKKLINLFNERSIEINKKVDDDIKAKLEKHFEFDNDTALITDSAMFRDSYGARNLAQVNGKNAKSDEPVSDMLARWRREALELDAKYNEQFIHTQRTYSQAELNEANFDYYRAKYLNALSQKLRKEVTVEDWERDLIGAYHNKSKEIATSENRIKASLAVSIQQWTDGKTAFKEANRIFEKYFVQAMTPDAIKLQNQLNNDQLTLEERTDLEIKYKREITFADREMVDGELKMIQTWEGRREESNFVLDKKEVMETIKKTNKKLKADATNKYNDLKSILTDEYLATLTDEKRAEEELRLSILKTDMETAGLKPEQSVAILNSTTKNGGMAMVIGLPGTGKSFQAKIVKDLYEANGFKVLAVGTSNKNTQNLKESIGADEARNTMQLIQDIVSGNVVVDSKTVVIADEFSMIDTIQFQKLTKLLSDRGAKMVASGDPSQTRPVGASVPFELLSKLDFNNTTLKNITRQKVDWQREASLNINDGMGHKTLLKYYENNRLSLDAKDLTEATSIAVDKFFEVLDKQEQERINDAKIKGVEYVAKFDPYDDVAVITSTNRTAEDANYLIREELKRRSVLKGKASYIKTTEDKAMELMEKDKIMFLESGKMKFNEDGTLWKYNPKTKKKPAFEINNGTEAIITKIDDKNRSFTVKDTSGKEFTIKLDQKLSLGFGYTYNIHKSQGQTKRESVLLLDKILDLNLLDVGATRHKEDMHIVANKSLSGKAELDIQRGEPLPEDIARVKQIVEEKELVFEREWEDVEKWTYYKTKNFLKTHDEVYQKIIEENPIYEFENMLMASTLQSEKKSSLDYKYIDERLATADRLFIEKQIELMEKAKNDPNNKDKQFIEAISELQEIYGKQLEKFIDVKSMKFSSPTDTKFGEQYVEKPVVKNKGILSTSAKVQIAQKAKRDEEFRKQQEKAKELKPDDLKPRNKQKKSKFSLKL